MTEILTITNDINTFNAIDKSPIKSESILSLLNQISSDKKAFKKSIHNCESNSSLVFETSQNEENKNDNLETFKDVRIENIN